MKIIIKEENLLTQEQYEITQQEAYIAEQFGIRQLNWQEFTQHCQFNKPALKELCCLHESPNLALPKSSNNIIPSETLSLKCATLIVNHIKHGNHSKCLNS
ncbi:MAG TPA: hypothetical protein VL201_02150 [Patescibacteria group bacterium]|jgi:hypothetical protein|nr:hypothetical protein [Patescibacteria group bacterium]